MRMIITRSLILLTLQATCLPAIGAPENVSGATPKTNATNDVRDAQSPTTNGPVDLLQPKSTKKDQRTCEPFVAVASLCLTGCGNFLCTKNGAVLINCLKNNRCDREGPN